MKMGWFIKHTGDVEKTLFLSVSTLFLMRKITQYKMLFLYMKCFNCLKISTLQFGLLRVIHAAPECALFVK